ncbi:MAG: biotin transporter BioY [Paracoccaceae bacterium]
MIAQSGNRAVLVETVAQRGLRGSAVREALLIAVGVAALTLMAKTSIPIGPVPLTLGTLAVLSIGAAYGPRLGLITILAYLTLGALGADVFAGDTSGLTYLMGGTGGYLLGYAIAAGALGAAARAGWDRSVWRMALAMLAGNALIYVPGLLWLRGFAEDWGQTLAWGLTPFLVGDAIKLALAALLFPLIWRLVGWRHR